MKYVLHNVQIIDGTEDGEMRLGADVYVEGNKIVKITDGKKLIEGYNVVECDGKYLLPGLINMHAHLFGSGKPSKVVGGGALQKAVVKFAKTALGHVVVDKLVAASVKKELYSGVTTVRGVGDFCYSDVRIRDRINAGKMLGPNLYVSGPAITVPGGHGDGTFAVTASSPEGLRKLVQNNAAMRVDLIKICITGGVMDAKKKGEPGELRMSAEQASAVTDEAHKLGLKVASHTESPIGMEVAIQSNVDTIEHGSLMTEASLEKLKAYDGALICTLSPALPLAKLDPSLTLLNPLCVYNSEVVYKGMIEGSKQALEKGVKVGLGTDASCPFAMQYNTWRELLYYQKMLGVSPSYAIYSATLGNARILGVDKQTGSVEEGKNADLIILEKNPLEDLRALREVDTVIIRGKRVKPRLKKDESIEKELDNLMDRLD